MLERAGREMSETRSWSHLSLSHAVHWQEKEAVQVFPKVESRENLGTNRRTNPQPSGALCSCRTSPSPLGTSCSCKALSLIPLAGAPKSEKNPHCTIQRAVTPAILTEAIAIMEQPQVVNNLKSVKAGKHRSSLELKPLRGPSYTCTLFPANHWAFWDLHPCGTASTQLSQANGPGRLFPP